MTINAGVASQSKLYNWGRACRCLQIPWLVLGSLTSYFCVVSPASRPKCPRQRSYSRAPHTTRHPPAGNLGPPCQPWWPRAWKRLLFQVSRRMLCHSWIHQKWHSSWQCVAGFCACLYKVLCKIRYCLFTHFCTNGAGWMILLLAPIWLVWWVPGSCEMWKSCAWHWRPLWNRAPKFLIAADR